MVLASAVIAGGTLTLVFFNIIPYPSFLWATLPFLLTTTTWIFRRIYHSERPKFMTRYLLSLVVKVLIYLAYLVVIILMDRPGAVPNAVFFLALYVAFTFIEIYFLYPKVSR